MGGYPIKKGRRATGGWLDSEVFKLRVCSGECGSRLEFSSLQTINQINENEKEVTEVAAIESVFCALKKRKYFRLQLSIQVE